MTFRSFFTLLFIICTFYARSQSADKIFYYNDKWEKTSSEKAEVKRVVKGESSIPESLHVIDYYMSGQKLSEGRYLDKDFKNKDGEFIYYYENGNKKEVINYSSGIQVGVFDKWYEDGKPKSSGEYEKIIEERSQYSIEKILTFYDSTGTKIVEEGEGFYYEPIEGTSKFVSGSLSKGLKNGDWTGYDTLVNVSYTDFYEYGEFISGKSVDGDGNTYVYKEISKTAEPLVGLKKLYQFVGENMTYPRKAQRHGISGIVFVKFTVGEDGALKDIHTVKGIGGECDEEAERVLKLAPFVWGTGFRRGKEMNEGVLPFRFILN